MRLLQRRVDEEQGIDISPLIDMVFILLIFFMVSTTFVKDDRLEIERPSASSATAASTKSVRVHIDAAANLFVDGDPVRPWMLQSRLRRLLELDSERIVLVIVDRRVPAERLIEVVDQCRLAGASEVGVATKKEVG